MVAKYTKDKSLIRILEALFDRFGYPNLDLVDDWPFDLQAIGIRNLRDREYLIGISTAGADPGRCALFVQDSTNAVIWGGNRPDKRREVDVEELAALVQKYLSLEPII